MIGLLKIGFTNDEIIDYRITDLWTTGVPEPFKLEAYTRVNNPNEVERQIHKIVDEYRLNKDREFFRISFDKLLQILNEKLPDIDWTLEETYDLIRKGKDSSWFDEFIEEVNRLEVEINNLEKYALTKNWGGDDINDPYGGVYYDNISKYNYIKIRIGQLRDALSKRPSVIDENVDGTITYNKGLYLKEDDKECKILFKKILEDFEKLKTSIN
jgi:hypothetical protein